MGGCFFIIIRIQGEKKGFFQKIHKIMAKRTLNLGCFKNNE